GGRPGGAAPLASAAWGDRTVASTEGTNLQRLTAAFRTAAVELEKVAAGLEADAGIETTAPRAGEGRRGGPIGGRLRVGSRKKPRRRSRSHFRAGAGGPHFTRFQTCRM